MAALSTYKAFHTISGNILLIQIHLRPKTVMRRMLFAKLVTNPSVDAVLPEEQPTVWGVLH